MNEDNEINVLAQEGMGGPGMKGKRPSREDPLLPIPSPPAQEQRSKKTKRKRRQKLNVATWNIRTLNDPETEDGTEPFRRGGCGNKRNAFGRDARDRRIRSGREGGIIPSFHER
eukprot:GHVN01107005.1.p3 GENE.GHVN01107005.1~~GHVN01107005.1.p3  ORF type:complete len:114 (-),score=11.56 GHVN01107005.1:608-949(-)